MGQPVTGLRWDWCRGFGGYFGSRRDWGDGTVARIISRRSKTIHRDLLLGDGVFRSDGGDVQGGFRRSILEDVGVFRVALAGAFTGEASAAEEFEVSNHQLGVRAIQNFAALGAWGWERARTA